MFFTVTLRESKYGVIAGILLGFARSLGEFGATIIFAGNIQGISRTIPLAIFQSIQTGNDNDLVSIMRQINLILESLGISFFCITTKMEFRHPDRFAQFEKLRQNFLKLFQKNCHFEYRDLLHQAL